MVVSIHSVVGLDFAGGLTTGWHSTQFPPFFVFGAMLSGLAAVIILIIPCRHFMHLEPYITARHFDVLGKLLLTSSLFMGYAYIMDAFDTFYGPDKAEKTMFLDAHDRPVRLCVLGQDRHQRAAAAALLVAPARGRCCRSSCWSARASSSACGGSGSRSW